MNPASPRPRVLASSSDVVPRPVKGAAVGTPEAGRRGDGSPRARVDPASSPAVHRNDPKDGQPSPRTERSHLGAPDNATVADGPARPGARGDASPRVSARGSAAGAVDVEVFWDRVHFMSNLERYRELAYLLCNNASYAATLGMTCDRKSAQLFASTFVELLDGPRLLELIEKLIEEEVKNTADEALGSLLRGNNALSKLESELAKRTGRVWLQQTLGPVMRVVAKDCAFYEVDPSRVDAALPKEQRAAVMDAGKQAVLELAEQVLGAVCSRESLHAMPQSMCRVASKTFMAARARGAEDPLAVAGGFLWLRVLSPALTAPGPAGLLPGGATEFLHAHTRRRLLLVTKVLQNASNNVEFGKKEPHMLQFNSFIGPAAKRIREFINAVCSESIEVDTSNDATIGGEPYADVSALDAINPTTLLSLHRLCVLFCDRWMGTLSKKGLMGKAGTRLVKVVGQLGPAPPPVDEDLGADVAAGGGEDNGGGGGGSSGGHTGAGAAATTSAVVGGVPAAIQLDDNALYWGPNSSSSTGAEVNQFYVIARRLRAELLSDAASLSASIVALLEKGHCHSKRYDVVFDMTYFTPTTSLSAVFNLATELYRQLSYEIRKNLRYGIVLHPDRVARAAVLFAHALASQKASKKLILCYSWQDLTRWMPANAVAIPEESKTHLLEAQSVTKINAAGKRQHRLVKLTARSLLNIDPQGPRVQNERAIGNIQRIALKGDRCVKLQFVDAPTAKKREWVEETVQQFAEKLNAQGGGMLNRLALSLRSSRASSTSAQDASERVYEFVNTAERNAFVLGILRLGLRIQKRTVSPLPHFFVVHKTGSVGQLQMRIWLLTTDSILNLDTALKVHSEIGLASIKWVRPDPDRADVVLLKALDREDPIEIKTEWREPLVAALLDALPNCQDSDASDSSHIHSVLADMDSDAATL